MANFRDALITDLKHSWFFRLWLLHIILWTIIFLAAFGSLVSRGVDSSEENNFRIRVKKFGADGFVFPEFNLLAGSAKDLIDQHNCTHGGTALATKVRKCGYGGTNYDCLVFDGTIKATESARDISCHITFKAPVGGGNPEAMQFQLNDVDLGTNAYSNLHITPTQGNGAWVLLTRSDVGDDTFWAKNLQYQSDQHDLKGDNVIKIVIDSFSVVQYYPYDGFDTWLTCSAIGGFLFFAYAWHAVLMFVLVHCVGVKNTSHVLSGNYEGSSYDKETAQAINTAAATSGASYNAL